jgi:hypothetical protein
LKADASASTGYVSKVGGDTVVASGAAVKPLILKGASSQTANLQEWQNSSGTVVASVSPTGNIVGGGLVHLNTTEFTTQTGVTVSNVFSSTYNFYRVVIGVKGSVNQDLFCRLALAGTPESGGNYYYQRFNAFSSSVSASSTSGTSLPIAPYSSSDNWSFSVELAYPGEAKATGLNSLGGRSDNIQLNMGTHNQATAYDGFNIFAGSGTITGTMSIYGYRK